MSTTPDPQRETGDAVGPTTDGALAPTAPATPAAAGGPTDRRWSNAVREIVGGSWAVSAGAVILALIAGSIMIVATDETVRGTAAYFFTRPTDMLSAAWEAIRDAYVALFRGAVWDYKADTFAEGIRPITVSLNYATPLIGAGLGLAVGFRAGLFNIGGQGQIIFAAIGAGWIGFAVDMPWPLHMLVAIVAGIAAGALWAGIAGVLKAFTGAHEVITTIMLNNIAYYLLFFMLATPGLLQAPGSANPKTPAMAESAEMPRLLGEAFPLHAGFLLALGAVAVTWWLLERSRLGFAFRAVGENPDAARVAGIDVSRVTIYVMLVSGGLIGVAGVSQVLGHSTTGFSVDVDAGIGFDAITVALLGRSSPIGVLGAGVLFGAFKAGGAQMQAAEAIPIEIVTVIQSLIVLFIAAPPLVRAIFRLPAPGSASKASRRSNKEVAA
ncbi:ABC transporter permease [Flavimobilis marinus]|uniref:Nucleoside ABC transporter membrane protein n=1 Tax=Flavimobilis marinus TaxID=285351 RepID=A0A1I2DPZ4_9MICO|nr:ABC transporter permease [Flavimobilis marinus]GHG44626.1 ABC transporter permease [Flavimobilis marinus]SFE82596.1 nucleoside ABC transporter membrane protein [Flavimobilis marinus]